MLARRAWATITGLYPTIFFELFIMNNLTDTEFQLKPVKFYTDFEEVGEKWGVEPADPRTVEYVVALPDVQFSSEEAARAFCAWLNETGQAGDFFDLMWDTIRKPSPLTQSH